MEVKRFILRDTIMTLDILSHIFISFPALETLELKHCSGLAKFRHLMTAIPPSVKVVVSGCEGLELLQLSRTISGFQVTVAADSSAELPTVDAARVRRRLRVN